MAKTSPIEILKHPTFWWQNGTRPQTILQSSFATSALRAKNPGFTPGAEQKITWQAPEVQYAPLEKDGRLTFPYTKAVIYGPWGHRTLPNIQQQPNAFSLPGCGSEKIAGIEAPKNGKPHFTWQTIKRRSLVQGLDRLLSEWWNKPSFWDKVKEGGGVIYLFICFSLY